MSKASKASSALPLHGSSTPSSSHLSRPRLLAAAALASVVLFSLSHSSSAQLLFPVNNNNAAPFPFDLEAHERLGDVQSGAGALWMQDRAPRVAIIGGGAGGSSAAFFLSHFGELEKLGLATDVTIYESLHYVGGRSTVVWPWNDDPHATPEGEDDFEAPVELGASIFVDANKNLAKAVRFFNLSTVAHAGEEGGGISIWDGTTFVYKESNGWGWWDLGKMFWRYGRSPLYVRSLVKTTVDSFLALYSPSFVSGGPFSSLASFALATNLTLPASLSAASYFGSNSISPLFTNELIAAATAVNYGSSVEEIHGLGALVSLAANGATAVVGGNRRIFEQFVGASGATLRMGKGARVREIMRMDGVAGRPQWVVRTDDGGGTYDAVIIAAPFHQTGIKILNSRAPALIPPQPYVHLHVSFILTNASSPSPTYFSLPTSSTISKAIFSTLDTSSPLPPAFNSLNYLKRLSPAVGARFGEGEWHVIKMFSAKRLGDDLLGEIFGSGNVGKTWRKEWDAYPVLEPVLEESDLAPVRPDQGLYYVNGFERLISTMETETVSAFNVVSLLLHDFFGYTSPTSWAEWEE